MCLAVPPIRMDIADEQFSKIPLEENDDSASTHSETLSNCSANGVDAEPGPTQLQACKDHRVPPV
eukprot:6323785-Amphidinium_carterae.1